jgi:hypothetical protein
MGFDAESASSRGVMTEDISSPLAFGSYADALRMVGVAPPGLLMGWLIPPPWLPTGEPRAVSIALRVPLPGTTFVNADNDAEFPLPIVEGDRLTVVEEVVSVSPEKQTRLGAGHFVETLDTYTRQDGAVVARNRNTLFRFTPGARS